MIEPPDHIVAYEAPIDRAEQPGSVKLVLALAGALVVAAVALSYADGEQAGFYIQLFLAFLASIGIFALFAVAIGILKPAGRRREHDFARTLLADAEDGLLVQDADGAIVFANRAYLALTGAEGARDVRTVERVFASDPDVAEAVYRLSQAAREGRRMQEEFRVQNGPRGAAAWFRIRVRPLRRSGHARADSAWSIADVTRDRERQENVFQELQHAIDFLDHAPAGFFSAETDGTISYMNATLAEWLDHDLAQIGAGTLRLDDVFAGNGASLVATLAGGAGTVKTEALDLDLKTRSGQSFPVRILHKIAYTADGIAGASKTLVLDRSRARGVADPLRAAEVQFARFFNNTPIAIATVDKAGRVRRANSPFARLFGDALKGGDRMMLSTVAEAGRAALADALAQAAEGQSDVRPVDGLIGETGKSARFYFSAVESGEDEDDGEAAILYALDTTEQRQLELQIAQSQKMETVGQLAGGIAHDFNNVLTAIIGYSDLLLTSHRPTDPSFRDIMQIKHNANRAAGLVRHLLAFSRRQTLRPQVLSLGEVLADLRMMLGRLLGEHVTLDVVHGRDLWLLRADLGQFEQVVTNLVVNARDAMPGGGKVTIRTRNVPAADVAAFGEPLLPAADWIMIEVEDSGTGIPKDIREKIFEPFFSTKDVGKGTGLGLSTVYGIVKQTEGYIFVDSEMGRGTTFRIFLPRHVPAVTAVPEAMNLPEPEAAAPKDMTGQGTVLLVEDEDAVRSFATRALESRGYTVLAANSGVEALDLLDAEAHGIDLVVSDVVMPEMDGPTLLKELRRRNPKIKIIFVSGYAEDAFKKNLAEDEEFVFLPKPFALKDLIQAVKDTIG
jgi:two-component system cell cycle sensor histidine kinase/response regulator CckA